MPNSTTQILLIEDDLQDVALIQTFMEKVRHFPAILKRVETLTEGLEYLQQGNLIDLVLLDLSLPDEQGLDTFRQVRAQFPQVPVVVLSGNSDEEVATAAVQEGAQDYLVKGEFDRNLLVRAIRYAIERQRQRLELDRQKRFLQASELRFHTIIARNADGMVIVNRNGIVLFANPAAEAILERKVEELVGSSFDFFLPVEETIELEIPHSSGEMIVVEMRLVEIAWDGDLAHLAILRDVTARKQAERALQLQAQREQLLFKLSERIRQSLELSEILETAVIQVQQFLNCDRVLIYRFGNGSDAIEAESVANGYAEILRKKVTGECVPRHLFPSRKPDDNSFEGITYTTSLELDYVNFIHPFEVRANLVIPILLNTSESASASSNSLWGLLIAHQYRSSRQWNSPDIEFIKRLAVQISIAIQQGSLYQRLETANQQLQRLACHDSLTGVFNRRQFDEQLSLEWRRLFRESAPLSLIMCDVDCFKAYNDTYGHQAGDLCLRQVADAISRKVRRPADFVARYGGEEFVVVLPNTNTEGAVRVAEEIRAELKALSLPHATSSASNLVTLSLGVASTIPRQEIPPELLIEAADQALYWAKSQGRDRVQVYQDNFSTEKLKQSRTLQWVRKLRQALEENRFCLYAQPIKSLQANGQRQHYEILLRFLDEENQIVLPEAFLPVAERYHFMPQIDRWVIANLFSYLAQLEPQVWENCWFAVNLSGETLNDSQFLEFVREQFQRYDLPPEMFCFEVTETVAISNLSQASQFVESLKALGCRFALDDFGSGMSSFAYLKNLPVDYLKIDGVFIKEMTSEPMAKAIVEAIHHLGKVMGLNTIAEFVETEVILDALRDLGVDYAQGYCLARPSPLDTNLRSKP